jgi:four helix bundle protein
MAQTMASVTDFENLACWQKARSLVNAVYEITKKGAFKQDFKLRDQLRSAAVSAMSNIAEGFARYHKKDFIRFLDIHKARQPR